MRVNEVESALRRRVNVTRHDVIVAKKYVIGNFQENPKDILNNLGRAQGNSLGMRVSWDDQADPEPQLQSILNHLRWQLAGCQAIWELIGAGYIISLAASTNELQIGVPYETARERGSWRVVQHSYTLPALIALAPTAAFRADDDLTEPAFFTAEAQAPSLEADVFEALQDAGQCFRHELYLPCLAMLGCALERAWIHTGLALVSYARGRVGFSAENLDKYEEGFRSPTQSLATTCDNILKIYDRSDVYGEIQRNDGCSVYHLRQAHIWSSQVRDSRNALHYDADPTLKNSYTKTAMLLIAAPECLGVLHTIQNTALKLAT
ncbi:MAG: hypothetical protein ACYC5M_09920 [Anaerolineae bacterium]